MGVLEINNTIIEILNKTTNVLRLRLAMSPARWNDEQRIPAKKNDCVFNEENSLITLNQP